MNTENAQPDAKSPYKKVLIGVETRNGFLPYAELANDGSIEEWRFKMMCAFIENSLTISLNPLDVVQHEYDANNHHGLLLAERT